MPDGQPDLQGTYDLATLTPLERPAGMKAVLTREEVAKLERAVAAQLEAGDRPSSGDRAAPPKGGDGSRGAAGNVGGYNSFWLDPGLDLHDRQRRDAHLDRRRSAGWHGCRR